MYPKLYCFNRVKKPHEWLREGEFCSLARRSSAWILHETARGDEEERVPEPRTPVRIAFARRTSDSSAGIDRPAIEPYGPGQFH